MVVLWMVKADKLLVTLNAKHVSICISTGVIAEDIYIKASKKAVSFVFIWKLRIKHILGIIRSGNLYNV